MNPSEEALKPFFEPWRSVEEIAGHLGVSKETIYRWLDRGGIPAHRIGRLWKFKTTEIDNWVRAGEAKEESTSVDLDSTGKQTPSKNHFKNIHRKPSDQ